MSAFEDGAIAPSRLTERRLLGLGVGFALAAAAGFLVHEAAPGAPAIMTAGLAALCGFAALALAVTLDDAALPTLIAAVAAAAGLPRFRRFRRAGGAAEADQFRFRCVRPGARLAACSHSAEARPGLAACRAVRRRARGTLGLRGLSRARLARPDDRRLHDLSWHCDHRRAARRRSKLAAPARRRRPIDHPGLFLGAGACSGPRAGVTNPTSRAIYTFALIALDAAPAALALSILARDLARRAGPAGGAQPAIVLALGAAAAFLAFPAAFAAAARGMPDVGGLVLVVCALRLAERLARLLALRKGHDVLIRPMIRRVAVALALTLYAMFAFRRWYAFAAVGIVIVLSVEVGALALRRGARFRRRDAVAAAALGALTLLALMSPVVVGWAPNLGAHDYAQTYAAYRKPWDVFLRELGDWVGLIPALAALAGAGWLWARSRDGRLLRLTLGGAAIAAALFLRIQTPYIHHLDLIAPAIAAPVAASLMLLLASALRPRFSAWGRSA